MKEKEMTNEGAMAVLKDFLSKQDLTRWKYSGEDYHYIVLAAEDALEALLDRDAIRDKPAARALADKLAADAMPACPRRPKSGPRM